MKVKDLIEELQKYDENFKVKLDCYDKDCRTPVDVIELKFEEQCVILS